MDEGTHDSDIAGWLGLLVDKTPKKSGSRRKTKKDKHKREVPIVKSISLAYTIEQLVGDGQAGRLTSYCAHDIVSLVLLNFILFECFPHFANRIICAPQTSGFPQFALAGMFGARGGSSTQMC